MIAEPRERKTSHTTVISSFVILALLLLCFQVCFSQSLHITRSISREEIQEVSIDRKGNLLYSDGLGNINKVGKGGKILQTFSPQKSGAVSLIEAWPMLRIFVFYKGPQEYLFLDRFMARDTRYTLRHNDLGFISMATISNDNGLWLIDDSDYTLKKLAINFNEVVVSTSLSSLPVSRKPEVNYMREYQNMLYINDRHSGIFVFDAYGNYLKTLPFKGLEYFNFSGEELYFLKQDTIHFFHLYDFEERAIKIPGEKTYSRVLIAGDLAYLISEGGIDLARIKN